MQNFYDLKAIEGLLNEQSPKQIVKLLDDVLYFMINYNAYEHVNNLSDYYHQLRLLRDSFTLVRLTSSEEDD